MLLTPSLHEYDGLSTAMSELHLWPAASNRTNWFQVSRVWYSHDIVRSFFWFIQDIVRSFFWFIQVTVWQECPWMNVYTVQLDEASEESRKELRTCQLVALLYWAKTAKTRWYSNTMSPGILMVPCPYPCSQTQIAAGTKAAEEKERKLTETSSYTSHADAMGGSGVGCVAMDVSLLPAESLLVSPEQRLRNVTHGGLYLSSSVWTPAVDCAAHAWRGALRHLSPAFWMNSLIGDRPWQTPKFFL